MNLFTCKNCRLFTPTPSNYGICKMKKIGGIDRAVYENADLCEMERRLFNNKLLNDRLNGVISHTEMYRLYRRS
jgi:hypothetical protein